MLKSGKVSVLSRKQRPLEKLQKNRDWRLCLPVSVFKVEISKDFRTKPRLGPITAKGTPSRKSSFCCVSKMLGVVYAGSFLNQAVNLEQGR